MKLLFAGIGILLIGVGVGVSLEPGAGISIVGVLTLLSVCVYAMFDGERPAR